MSGAAGIERVTALGYLLLLPRHFFGVFLFIRPARVADLVKGMVDFVSSLVG